MHCASACADTQRKRDDFKLFITAVTRTLPCEKCKAHFLENQKIYDINQYSTSNKSLFLWTYLMHDAVNAAQGKTGDQRPSFETVFRMYFDVPSDVDAVEFKELHQNDICTEVCSQQKLFDSNRKINEMNSEKSSTSIKKFTTRKNAFQ